MYYPFGYQDSHNQSDETAKWNTHVKRYRLNKCALHMVLKWLPHNIVRWYKFMIVLDGNVADLRDYMAKQLWHVQNESQQTL